MICASKSWSEGASMRADSGYMGAQCECDRERSSPRMEVGVLLSAPSVPTWCPGMRVNRTSGPVRSTKRTAVHESPRQRQRGRVAPHGGRCRGTGEETRLRLEASRRGVKLSDRDPRARVEHLSVSILILHCGSDRMSKDAKGERTGSRTRHHPSCCAGSRRRRRNRAGTEKAARCREWLTRSVRDD